MVRTVLTKTVALGGSGAGIALTGVAVTMTAGDAGNGNSFVHTGRELIIARNSGAGARTITLTSVRDTLGRLGTITAESIAAGAIRVFGPFPTPGWQQADGSFYIDVEHAEVLLGIIVLP